MDVGCRQVGDRRARFASTPAEVGVLAGDPVALRRSHRGVPAVPGDRRCCMSDTRVPPPRSASSASAGRRLPARSAPVWCGPEIRSRARPRWRRGSPPPSPRSPRSRRRRRRRASARAARQPMFRSSAMPGLAVTEIDFSSSSVVGAADVSSAAVSSLEASSTTITSSADAGAVWRASEFSRRSSRALRSRVTTTMLSCGSLMRLPAGADGYDSRRSPGQPRRRRRGSRSAAPAAPGSGCPRPR